MPRVYAGRVKERLVQVTSTFDDEEAALELADGVVRARLAARGQVEGAPMPPAGVEDGYAS
jgi:hypothetical protein